MNLIFEPFRTRGFLAIYVNISQACDTLVDKILSFASKEVTCALIKMTLPCKLTEDVVIDVFGIIFRAS